MFPEDEEGQRQGGYLTTHLQFSNTPAGCWIPPRLSQASAGEKAGAAQLG